MIEIEHRPMDGEIIEADEVSQAAEYVASSWRQGVEAIIETGRRLIEIRERFKDDRGKWSRLIGANQWDGQGLLPFGRTHVQRLVAIAADDRICPHVGILPSDSYTLHKLTQLSDQRFEELLETGRIHPGMKRNEASAETRQERRSEDERRIQSLVPTQGKFRTLVVDPPWDYEWLSIAGRASPGYNTMSHDELLALDVGQWAEENCHMYLWVTNNFLTRGVELMAHWGFQHKTVLTWVKPRIGLGSYFRNSTEHALFGVRGELRTRSDSIPTHFEAPLGEHSEKPEEFYNIARAASHPPFGEIFQRQERPDFTNCFTSVEKTEAA